MASRPVLSFDIGGTLLHSLQGGFCSQLAHLLERDIEDIRPLLIQYFLTRKIGIDEAINAFCTETGLTTIDKLKSHYKKADVGAYDEVTHVLRQLYLMGFQMITVSNCTSWEAGGLEELGLSSFFSRNFYSFEIGFAKPDERAFAFVEQEMDLGPTSFLHIGDSLGADVLGAASRGWRAVHVKRSGVPNSSSYSPTINSLADLPFLLQN